MNGKLDRINIYKCYFFSIVIVCLSFFLFNENVKAEISTVKGNIYFFDDDENYVSAESDSSMVVNGGTSSTSGFCIEGQLNKTNKNQDCDSFDVLNGTFDMYYSIKPTFFGNSDYEWHIVEDDDDDIEDMKLDDDIKTGAIVLKSSYNGIKWSTDKVMTDVFSDKSLNKINIWQGTENQLVNGCYYQVYIVYKKGRRLEDKSIIGPLSVKNYEYKWFEEKYTFYVENSAESERSLKNEIQKKQLGSKIRTEKNEGYYEQLSIDKDDLHYGWDLGAFYISGYTDEADKDENDCPVFLKVVNNRVTLWFDLQQDIDRLNQKDNLSIAENNGGYDKYFEIPQTNFKHGALIIRHTDSQGNKSRPIIYTDFLSAQTRTNAATKVELFEEGDYEVSLDYQINNSNFASSNADYKIYFKFKIRNGNCKAFFKDSKTKSELRNGDLTSSGFFIDMAQSKYLKCSVKREEVITLENGKHALHVASNTAAQHEDKFDREGIYTIIVNNKYAGDKIDTEYTLYVVNNNKLIKALAKNKLTIDELDNMIADGVRVSDDGELITPTPLPTATPVPTMTPVPTVVSNDVDVMTPVPTESIAKIEQDSIPVKPEPTIEPSLSPVQKNNDTSDLDMMTEAKGENSTILVLLIGIVIGVILLGGIILIINKNKTKED